MTNSALRFSSFISHESTDQRISKEPDSLWSSSGQLNKVFPHERHLRSLSVCKRQNVRGQSQRDVLMPTYRSQHSFVYKNLFPGGDDCGVVSWLPWTWMIFLQYVHSRSVFDPCASSDTAVQGTGLLSTYKLSIEGDYDYRSGRLRSYPRWFCAANCSIRFQRHSLPQEFVLAGGLDACVVCIHREIRTRKYGQSEIYNTKFRSQPLRQPGAKRIGDRIFCPNLDFHSNEFYKMYVFFIFVFPNNYWRDIVDV